MTFKLYCVLLSFGASLFSCENVFYKIKVDSPAELLSRIVQWEQEWNKAALLQAVYAIELENMNTGEALLRGIMGHREGGSFAYSRTSFRLISSKYSSDFRSLYSEEFDEFFPEGERLAKDPLLSELAKDRSADHFRIFRKKIGDHGLMTTLLFVRHEETWKLVYSFEATLITE